jgi:beta-lactamase superfamily II metal-dependent hydrolase
MSNIGFEIDFLPVGNGDRSGDAIALRYGNPGNYKVMVYDGGTKESGEMLVSHINKYYGTNYVDYVVNSHPDADHSSGLAVVLEQMRVGQLWMHKPWSYSSTILGYFKDGRITDNSLAERLKNSMGSAYALQQIAEKRGIAIYEPFLGAQIGDFVVLSPEKNWYVHNLIEEFQKSPEQKKADEYASMTFKNYLKAVSEGAKAAISWVAEHWGIESLRDDVETSAENESSVILYGVIADKGILLTGDAGARALTAVADVTEANRISLPDTLKFIQIPHHGSRHNVSSSILDRIIGPRKSANDGQTTKIAFISADKESTQDGIKCVHPSRGQSDRHERFH